MLTWFRLRASSLAAAVLLSLGTLGVSLLGGHPLDCRDTDNLAVVVAHDASTHRIESESAETDDEPRHCLICHFARSFRPDIVARFDPAPATAAGDPVLLDIVAVARIAPISQPPLRSPPSSPVLS